MRLLQSQIKCPLWRAKNRLADRVMRLMEPDLRAMADRVLTRFGIPSRAMDSGEAVQNWMLVLLRRTDKAGGLAVHPFTHWRIMMQACGLARTRKRKRNVTCIGDAIESHAALSASPREVPPDVQWALEALPPRQRRALELRYLQGLTRAEAAVRLGTSARAVSILICRGRATLRKRVRPRAIWPEPARRASAGNSPLPARNAALAIAS